MVKKYNILFVLLLFSVCAFPQAGKGVYSFLDLPVSSRISALGGTNVSLADDDINFVFKNPALLTPQSDKVIGLNFTNYLTDINYGSAVYGMTFGDKNYMAFGIQYANYGNFAGYDESGQYVNDFTAQDLGFYVSYARPIADKITVGATLKPIVSVYEVYTSVGLGLDLGASYINEDILFSAGLVFRNIGTQLKGYYSDEEGQHYEPLPFDVQLGATKQLRHAPIRFSLTLHNLHRWNLAYQSTNQTDDKDLLGEDSQKENKGIGFFDMAFRHAIIGVEFLPMKNFYVSVAYNHRRARELSMNGFKSLAGFSFGAGIKIYKFQVGFGMTQFQAGLNSYQFSIMTSLNDFRL